MQATRKQVSMTNPCDGSLKVFVRLFLAVQIGDGVGDVDDLQVAIAVDVELCSGFTDVVGETGDSDGCRFLTCVLEKSTVSNTL